MSQSQILQKEKIDIYFDCLRIANLQFQLESQLILPHLQQNAVLLYFHIQGTLSMYNFQAFILSALLVKTLTQTTILARSNLQTTIVTPGFFTALAGFHNVYHPNMVGPGTFWIWNNEGMLSPQHRTLTFEILLYSSCSAPAQLNITADDSFIVYLDTQLILKGNNWRTIYTTTIDLTCGSHNLTIVVSQGFGQFGPGLIYQLTQDQTSCYQCGLNGFWDFSTCSCRCLTICGCANPQIWMDFPVCSCRCPTINLGTGISKQQQKVLTDIVRSLGGQVRLKMTCPQGQHYNQQTCSCECVPKFCHQRYRWNANPLICACQFSS